MKRLLFSPSILTIALLAGCTTQLVDSQGKPVYDSFGNAVMVSSSTKETVEKSTIIVRDAVRREIESVVKSGKTITASSIALTDEKARSFAEPWASAEDIAAIKAIMDAEARKYLVEEIYPARVTETKKAIDATVASLLAKLQFSEASTYLLNIKKTGIKEIDEPVKTYAAEQNKLRVAPVWANAIIERIKPFIDKQLANGNYATAREALWRAPTTGNADVDALVRKYAVEKMRVTVNPTEWVVIEAELKAKVAELETEKKFDEAIEWLKAYRRVRTYSLLLDEKLKTVEAELVKVGVAEEKMKSILDATGRLVGDAAKILDMTDVTTNTVTTIEGKEIAGFEPDLKEYKAKLEDYRKMLVRHDCTEEAAKGIVDKFQNDVTPLLSPLSKPGSKEEGKSETKAFLQLGTGALNARIDKTTAALIADMEAKKAAYLKTLRDAAITAAIDELTAKVKQLVADGEYAQAREVIWSSTSTEDLDMNAHLRKVGIELLLKLVNPSNWAAIEKEFSEKEAEAKENSSYDEAIAWIESYPVIRTYTATIDEKLEAVKDELSKIGIDSDKVQPVVDETQKATVEVERLASHVDTVEKTVTEGKNKPTLSTYEKLLADYRTALVRNDCTESNADKLVENFKAKIAPYIEILSGGEEKTELLLGSNAINDRLVKLRAKTVDALKLQKYKYVFSDLIAKVSEAVAEGRYTDARNIVRDVKLVNDTAWDAKIYTTRIGLLNSVVNPNQCIALLKEIDEKAKELFDANRYEDFREYAKNYEYVHDTYQQIIDALAQVKIAMVGLTITEKDAEEYISKVTASIRNLMEKRAGSYSTDTDKDLAELEKALAELEKGIVAQYYKPEEVAEFCKLMKAEIIARITKAPDPMTTCELNETLRARLAMYTAQLDDLIAKRDAAKAAEAYAKLLADIDAEVSFDSQIAMAEDAIAKQLGVKCPFAYLRMNALLGEYARTMRLLKLGKKIESEQATVALLGGVYLDQPAVVTRALELGADANGKSARDPLGRTGVLIAIQSGHNSFLKQLADAGAALDPADVDCNTALHYAVHRGNLAVVKVLLKKNDVNKVNKSGESALFIAVRKNQDALAAALTAAKADVKIKNAKGQTAMDVACLAGSRDVLDTLAKAGAEYGPNQLKIAAAKNRLAVAQWLIGMGVDVNAPGVMESTVSKSDTQHYLVHEGGILQECEEKDCKTKTVEKKEVAPAPTKVAEVTGTINFNLSEVSVSKEK